VNKLLNNPIFLLLGTGLGLGAIAPLGKIAMASGVDPFLWVALFLAVSGALLLFLARHENWGRGDLFWFGIGAGIFANVIPNSLLLFAIPHIGSGLGGLMFALSPVVTAVLSVILKVRPPNRALILSVAVGFVGALMIVSGRNGLALPTAPSWLLLALFVPASLAIGNVFRTAFWPKGASPMQAGAAANLLSVPPLIALSAWNGGLDLAPIVAIWPITIAQWVASILMYLLFFRLQFVGGPTYLSQIGYVAASVGLAVGALVFDETYPALVWLGAAFILAGILALFIDQSRKPAA
jgi:drug/metabolite transporter (DMT)-like permease